MDVKLMTKINDKKVGARFSISAIRYNTRRYFNVRSKPTRVSLIYRTKPTTEKWETEKL